MKSVAFALGLAPLALLAGCMTAEGPETGVLSRGDLVDASGQTMGRAQLLKRGDRVLVTVEATGLTPGQHGVHVHEKGVCEGPDFTSAGGHLNPAHRSHGTLSANPKHLGDLPNLLAGADGRGTLRETLSDLYGPTTAGLFDADGSALVIHADPDDYKSDPAGASGKRIACAVLKPFS